MRADRGVRGCLIAVMIEVVTVVNVAIATAAIAIRTIFRGLCSEDVIDGKRG